MRCYHHKLNKALCQVSMFCCQSNNDANSCMCVCVWQAHFKELANSNKLCLAYAMISMGYISYTSFFAPRALPPDLTRNRLVNELCNLLKGSHIMWKKLKTLSRPAGCILNTQSWQLRVWQTPHVLGCTVRSPSWHLGVSSLLQRLQSLCQQCGTCQ